MKVAVKESSVVQRLIQGRCGSCAVHDVRSRMIAVRGRDFASLTALSDLRNTVSWRAC